MIDGSKSSSNPGITPEESAESSSGGATGGSTSVWGVGGGNGQHSTGYKETRNIKIEQSIKEAPLLKT